MHNILCSRLFWFRNLTQPLTRPLRYQSISRYGSNLRGRILVCH